MRRLSVLAALALAFVVAGCGGDTRSTTIPGISAPVPGGADPADVKVIDAWVSTLRAGDAEGAAEYFAIPSVAENGPVIRIDSARDAVLFNRSLPCGARLVRAVDTGRTTTATFVLTERPGPGVCGAGTGSRARTAFVIEDGKIVRWIRVPAGGGGGGAPAPVI